MQSSAQRDRNGYSAPHFGDGNRDSKSNCFSYYPGYRSAWYRAKCHSYCLAYSNAASANRPTIT
jgi:hypothetical protein